MHCNHTPEEIAKRIAKLPEPLREIKIGEKYYWLGALNLINWHTSNDDNTDCDLQKIGNIFATEQDAQAHADFRKWLYEKPKLTIDECWTNAFDGYLADLYTKTAAAEKFIQLARDNGHV